MLQVQQNFEAVKRAAEQGNAEDQYNLGMMYANGRGVEPAAIPALLPRIWRASFACSIAAAHCASGQHHGGKRRKRRPLRLRPDRHSRPEMYAMPAWNLENPPEFQTLATCARTPKTGVSDSGTLSPVRRNLTQSQ